MKTCTKCNVTKSSTDFYFKGKKSNGKLQSECKVCFNTWMSHRWMNYKEKLIKTKNINSCCSICGYNKCIAALEFHHLESEEKDFNISKGYSYSFKRLVAELSKCILVCANCHREIHNGC